MPPSSPGSLGNQINAQILAYLFQVNGFRPGDKDLPSDSKELASMTIPRAAAEVAGLGAGGGLSPFAPVPPVVTKTQSPREFTPSHRRDVAESARRGLAELAANLRRLWFQSAQAD